MYGYRSRRRFREDKLRSRALGLPAVAYDAMEQGVRWLENGDMQPLLIPWSHGAA